MYVFYGNEDCEVNAIDKSYGADTPKELYDRLSDTWCVETCAPRLRDKWSEQNKTCGQCSITAFLVQDIFGGIVRGVALEDGNFHCYNVVDGKVFDLTSEQFDEVLTYSDSDKIQERSVHFAKEEKYRRYLLLKKLLKENMK